MNIFNYLSNILFTKKQPKIDDISQSGDYQPFLINRWCSMLNKQTASIVNQTSNMLYMVLENKTDHYRFLHYILPRERFKKINYIKKVKNDNNNDDILHKMAKRLELSKREINLYSQQLKIDLTKYEYKK